MRRDDPAAREHVTGYFKLHPEFVHDRPRPCLSRRWRAKAGGSPSTRPMISPSSKPFMRGMAAQGRRSLARRSACAAGTRTCLRAINAHVQQKPIAPAGGAGADPLRRWRPVRLWPCQAHDRSGARAARPRRHRCVFRRSRHRRCAGAYSTRGVCGQLDRHAPRCARQRRQGAQSPTCLFCDAAGSWRAANWKCLRTRLGLLRRSMTAPNGDWPAMLPIIRLAAGAANSTGPAPYARRASAGNGRCLAQTAIDAVPRAPNVHGRLCWWRWAAATRMGSRCMRPPPWRKLDRTFRARFVIGQGMANKERVARRHRGAVNQL